MSEEFIEVGYGEALQFGVSQGIYYKDQKQVVESLRQQLDWVRNILASHGYDGPLGGGCCPLAEWLNEREELRQQLADHIKREVMLRKGFTDILTDTCEKFPGQRMMQIMGICHEALAATEPK